MAWGTGADAPNYNLIAYRDPPCTQQQRLLCNYVRLHTNNRAVTVTLPITGKLLPLCRDWRPEKLYHLHGKGILNAASILPPAVSPAPGQSCKATTQEPQKCLVVSAETLGESQRRGIVGVPRGHLLWSPCASSPKPMPADTLIRNHPPDTAQLRLEGQG